MTEGISLVATVFALYRKVRVLFLLVVGEIRQRKRQKSSNALTSRKKLSPYEKKNSLSSAKEVKLDFFSRARKFCPKTTTITTKCDRYSK